MRTTEVDVHPTGDYNYNDYQMDEDIAYNPDSSVASITDGLGSAAESYTFTMDQLGRLSGWSNGAGLNCTLFADQYGYTGDSSGNPSCGLLTGVSFNGQNQIVGWVYDASGEPLSDTAGTSYAWNVEGRARGPRRSHRGRHQRGKSRSRARVASVSASNAPGERSGAAPVGLGPWGPHRRLRCYSRRGSPAERQAGRSANVSRRFYSRDREPSGVPRQSIEGDTTTPPLATPAPRQ